MFINIQESKLHINIFTFLDYLNYVDFTMICSLASVIDKMVPEIKSRLNKEKEMYKTAHYFLMEIKEKEQYEKERDDYHREYGYGCVCDKNYDGGPFCTYCREIALCSCPYCQ